MAWVMNLASSSYRYAVDCGEAPPGPAAAGLFGVRADEPMNLWMWLAVPLMGLVLGLFGAGGGMLTVPILMYGAGLPIKQAIAVSLWIVAAVSLITATHQRAWRVLQHKLLIFFSVGGLGGSVVGAWVGTWIDPLIQQGMFAVLLFVVAWWLLRVKLHDSPQDKPCHCSLALVTGFGLGVVTGLLGVGGGFLMVPALVLLGVSHLPTAVAHSLVLIAANATVSGFTYAGSVDLPVKLMVAMVLVAAVGSLIGSYLLNRLPVGRLQWLLSVVLVVLGIVMLGHLVVTA
jgi:uncharacterized membrane protein YfcA